MENHVPPSEAERILRTLAPELAGPVHAFLHGGAPGRLQQAENDSAASLKLRELHNGLDDARLKRAPIYEIAVLTVAVRLQAVVLYETIKALHGANAATA